MLGLRLKQLNNGAKPFIKIADNIIDNYLIALEELKQKKLPFIICRPLNQSVTEYWDINDLDIMD